LGSEQSKCNARDAKPALAKDCASVPSIIRFWYYISKWLAGFYTNIINPCFSTSQKTRQDINQYHFGYEPLHINIQLPDSRKRAVIWEEGRKGEREEGKKGRREEGRKGGREEGMKGGRDDRDGEIERLGD
jgi:hypothetical protein